MRAHRLRHLPGVREQGHVADPAPFEDAQGEVRIFVTRRGEIAGAARRAPCVVPEADGRAHLHGEGDHVDERRIRALAVGGDEERIGCARRLQALLQADRVPREVRAVEIAHVPPGVAENGKQGRVPGHGTEQIDHVGGVRAGREIEPTSVMDEKVAASFPAAVAARMPLPTLVGSAMTTRFGGGGRRRAQDALISGTGYVGGGGLAPCDRFDEADGLCARKGTGPW